jgi:hypothetical protein
MFSITHTLGPIANLQDHLADPYNVNGRRAHLSAESERTSSLSMFLVPFIDSRSLTLPLFIMTPPHRLRLRRQIQPLKMVPFELGW